MNFHFKNEFLINFNDNRIRFKMFGLKFCLISSLNNFNKKEKINK